MFVNLAYSLICISVESILTAFVSNIPKSKLSCLSSHLDALAISLSAIATPCHVPLVIVPTVVIVFVPVHVDNPIFSTLFKFKSVLTSL